MCSFCVLFQRHKLYNNNLLSTKKKTLLTIYCLGAVYDLRVTSCPTSHVADVIAVDSSSSGYVSNTLGPSHASCGRSSCPWVVRGVPGQRVQLSVVVLGYLRHPRDCPLIVVAEPLNEDNDAGVFDGEEVEKHKKNKNKKKKKEKEKKEEEEEEEEEEEQQQQQQQQRRRRRRRRRQRRQPIKAMTKGKKEENNKSKNKNKLKMSTKTMTLASLNVEHSTYVPLLPGNGTCLLLPVTCSSPTRWQIGQVNDRVKISVRITI